MQKNLTGPRLHLRRIRLSDARSIRANVSDRKVAHFLGVKVPMTVKGAEQVVKSIHSHTRRKKGMWFGIEEPGTKEIIGFVSLRDFNNHDRSVKLGYWIGRRFWRKGYTYEAVQLVVRYAFNDLKMYRVYAAVHAPNVASARLLIKAGFSPEGTSRKASVVKGRRLDILWFGMLKPEFKRQ